LHPKYVFRTFREKKFLGELGDSRGLCWESIAVGNIYFWGFEWDFTNFDASQLACYVLWTLILIFNKFLKRIYLDHFRI
jgi:hypothetical protein